METTTTADPRGRNWYELPEDILLTVMSAMEVLDVVRSSAVCSSWRSTYATFRRLRLPSPKQSPCLLYPDVAALCLYSPSADATFRMQLPHHAVVLAGSAHGWLFATDQAANPYLLNPLTGAQAVLPPVTTFECVVGSSLDDDGNIVYHTDDPSLGDARFLSVTEQIARSWMYRHVALSAGGTAPSCVVLVVHERQMGLHFSRPGDKRWSSLSSVGPGFVSAVYNEKDGLFHALDLHGQTSPTARILMRTGWFDAHRPYLAIAPCGDVLLVARTTCQSERPDIYDCWNALSIYKLDPNAKKKVKLEGIGDHVLLLADFTRWIIREREVIRRRDIAIYWDFETGNMHNVANLWPLHLLQIPDTAPAPIWITPSPF